MSFDLVTFSEKGTIFMSNTSRFILCYFVHVMDSRPYIIAWWSTILWTFPFRFVGILLSYIIPDTPIHQLHPACIFMFNTISESLLLWTVDLKHLNSHLFNSLLLCRHVRHSNAISLLSISMPLLLCFLGQLSCASFHRLFHSHLHHFLTCACYLKIIDLSHSCILCELCHGLKSSNIFFCVSRNF